MKKIGRPLDIQSIKKVQEYRSRGMSFREIAKLMDEDVKSVHRWANYTVGDTVDKSHLTHVGKRVK